MSDLARISVDSSLPPTVTGTVVTVGTFDGVHRGHLDVLSRLVSRSNATGLPSVLVSFDPHPLEVVNPAAAPMLLTSHDEKLELIAESGIDYFAVVPFTSALSSYSAEEFVDHVLRRRFRMRELLIGHDHGFGHHRAGNVTVLQQLGKRWSFGVDVVEAVSHGDGQHVSSTSIRRAIAGGDLDRASEGLGRRYSVAGSVVRGQGRGRDMGFATINVVPQSPRKLLPPKGVYAVIVQTPAGPFGGMMNLGPRPTFGESDLTLEAHLFDANQDFYDANVRIDFVQYLRDTRKFAGADELIRQLARDRENALRALTLPGGSGSLKGYVHDFTRTIKNES
ncbi:MAG TPA: bifunctional riboflavin kinase/FAD synthetase [Gemmatimonadaceae bacterium]|jgi:riboflavin kinase/FMN adenylyltransferase|nr:bifunctional riboflavin kinase/FAD synthetase [Gemmatimonadaceae bacterium]